MSMRAIRQVYRATQALAPVKVTATTTATVIDFQDCIENAIYLFQGINGDGVHTFTYLDSPDNTTFTACAAGDILGSWSVVSLTAAAATQVMSYIGAQRYLKIVDTMSGSITLGMTMAMEVIGKYKKLP